MADARKAAGELTDPTGEVSLQRIFGLSLKNVPSQVMKVPSSSVVRAILHVPVIFFFVSGA